MVTAFQIGLGVALGIAFFVGLIKIFSGDGSYSDPMIGAMIGEISGLYGSRGVSVMSPECKDNVMSYVRARRHGLTREQAIAHVWGEGAYGAGDTTPMGVMQYDAYLGREVYTGPVSRHEEQQYQEARYSQDPAPYAPSQDQYQAAHNAYMDLQRSMREDLPVEVDLHGSAGHHNHGDAIPVNNWPGVGANRR